MHAPLVNLNTRRLLPCDGPCPDDWNEAIEKLSDKYEKSGSDFRPGIFDEGAFGEQNPPAFIYWSIRNGCMFRAVKGCVSFVENDPIRIFENDEIKGRGSFNTVKFTGDGNVLRESKKKLPDHQDDSWYTQDDDIGVAALELMTALLAAKLGIGLPISQGQIVGERIRIVMPAAVFLSSDEFHGRHVEQVYAALSSMAKEMKMAHLDCKPGNIAHRCGEVFLTDFGNPTWLVRSTLPESVLVHASMLVFAANMSDAGREAKEAIKKILEATQRGITIFNVHAGPGDDGEAYKLSNLFRRRAMWYLGAKSPEHTENMTLAAYIKALFGVQSDMKRGRPTTYDDPGLPGRRAADLSARLMARWADKIVVRL